MFELTGKSVLIAGGAGYLGEAMCRHLVTAGARLMIADLAGERARTLATQLAQNGTTALDCSLDVVEESSIRAAVDRTVDAYGKIDVLINATFHSSGKHIDDLTAEEFDRANQVNLTGAFLLARAAAEKMPEGGSIVMFSSMYGQVSPDPRVYRAPMQPNPIEYGVGKAGIIQMTRYLAVAWAPRKIRVNAIAPGPFPNPFVQVDHPDFVRRLAERVPMGRIGEADEIAGAVLFLASDASSYVTGEVIGVNGGWTAW